MTAPLRAPQLPELVADALRSRILSRELGEGDRLPTQDEILQTFGVSRPAVRGALRILEAEGLITVQRGKVGGARVHGPSPASAAYPLALVLEADRVTLADLGAALAHLEPVCAALSAARGDRARTVLPGLRAAHRKLAAAIERGDGRAAVDASRLFHERVVASCGNHTMIAVVGALESLWSAQEEAWAERATRRGTFPDHVSRVKAYGEHDELIRLIQAGDVDAVTAEARRHLVAAQQYPLSGGRGPVVRADCLRRSAVRP
jgi:DNA-binding FadR family transcriptional regulator